VTPRLRKWEKGGLHCGGRAAPSTLVLWFEEEGQTLSGGGVTKVGEKDDKYIAEAQGDKRKRKRGGSPQDESTQSRGTIINT